MSREEAGRRTFLKGALDLLVLRVLARGPQHGFGITKMLSELSRDWLQIEEGSLYPCLYRLEERGWVKSSVSSSENNRRARYYELTRKGKRGASPADSDLAGVRQCGGGSFGLKMAMSDWQSGFLTWRTRRRRFSEE